MSSSTFTARSRDGCWAGRLADYVELTKPRIAMMAAAAVLAAALVARQGRPELAPLLFSVLGVLLVAGSASAINQWLERGRDRLMSRTASRPVPAGRLTGRHVLALAAPAFVVGTGLLWAVDGTAALWGATAWVVYGWIYTPLKSRTPLNTPIGALAGASPVLVGWCAMGAEPDLRVTALYCAMFLWQFPHFMAIAWIYREQYRRAGLQVLTVVEPSGRLAGIQAASTALMLLPVSCVPLLLIPGSNRLAWTLAAGLLGLAFFAFAVAFSWKRTAATARLLLRASLVYLPALLGLVVLSCYH